MVEECLQEPHGSRESGVWRGQTAKAWYEWRDRERERERNVFSISDCRFHPAV